MGTISSLYCFLSLEHSIVKTMTNLLRLPYTLIRPLYERTTFHTGVIDELSDQDLRIAYSHCRRITREYAKTFYMATRFLPYGKQRGIFAIYALCRYIDDLVDESKDLAYDREIEPGNIGKKLDVFSNKLIGSYRGWDQNDPILTAFSDVLKRYNISIDLPLTLIDGVRTDLGKNRYKDFDEVYEYSYKVASVVGLMTSEIFGYSEPKALDYAVDLGIAMQLTNILRDVGEDIDRNRIYLPMNELEEFGIAERQLFEKSVNDNFRSFIQFQIERARTYYEKADLGIRMLNKDSRLPVALARENYSRILDKIEENDFQVFHTRAYLNSREKISILPRVVYKIKF